MSDVDFVIRRELNGVIEYYMLFQAFTADKKNAYRYGDPGEAAGNIKELVRSDRINGRPEAKYFIEEFRSLEDV